VYVLQSNVITEIPHETRTYHQNGVFVDNKDAEHAESDWLAVQTAQKHIYLHIYPHEIYENYTRTKFTSTHQRGQILFLLNTATLYCDSLR